jgi:hypothetical protein
MEKDLEHLKLLGIFHYIWGALSLIGGLFIGGYFLIIGIVLMTIPRAQPHRKIATPRASLAGF